MKICKACAHRFDGPTWRCIACGHEPAVINGYPAFAPELAEKNEGFEAEYFSELARLEPNNFWFRSRNRLVVWALQTFSPEAKTFLEIGCGTGYVLSGIRKELPHLKLSGSEIFSEGLTFAAKRLPDVNLFQMDARQIPFEAEFDVIGAFDVLEHIKDDELVLSQMWQALRPGGELLLTVPQHAFLWSETDDYAHHVRRYNASELRAKVEAAGFRLIKSTSFVSLLMPLMLLARTKQRNQKNFDPLAELEISGLMNSSLEKVLDLERTLIRFGIPFPVGGSRLLVARRQ